MIKCYHFNVLKLDTTNYLTQDVNYGIIKIHQEGEISWKAGKSCI